MSVFVDKIRDYASSININYDNFVEDENELFMYKLNDLDDEKCMLRYSFIVETCIEVYLFNKTFSNNDLHISKMYIGYITKRKGFIFNLTYDVNLLEEAFNYRHFMIEFFSAFDIKNDGSHYIFDQLYIYFANNYLIVIHLNKQYNITSIDEFIGQFPEIYDYQKNIPQKLTISTPIFDL